MSWTQILGSRPNPNVLTFSRPEIRNSEKLPANPEFSGPNPEFLFVDKRQDSSSIRTLVLYLFLIPIYESLRRFTGTSPLEYNKSEFDLHVNLFSKWASVVLRRRLCNQRALRNRNRNAATRLPGSYCTVAVVSSPFEILFWFCIFWTSPSKVNSSFSFRDSGKCPEFRPNPKAKKFSRTRTRNPEFGIRVNSGFFGPEKKFGTPLLRLLEGNVMNIVFRFQGWRMKNSRKNILPNQESLLILGIFVPQPWTRSECSSCFLIFPSSRAG